jgi:uncharacterized protein YdaU (DUF1376 family)
MAPESRPAFLFYPADFLSDMRSAMMPYDARGVFTTLLCHQWIEKGLPVAAEELAALLKLTPRRWRAQWPLLASRFREVDGHLVNPRLEAERQRQAACEQADHEERARAVEKARLAAQKRWRHG